MAAVGTLLQILMAVIVVIILLAIGFSIFNMEKVNAIRQAGNLQKQVPIFTGVKDLSIYNNEVYNTINPYDMTYKDLSLSANQGAGAEFTYNFWLYLDNSDGLYTSATDMRPDAGLEESDFVLFMKGDSRAYTYNNVCYGNTRDTTRTTKTDVLVKCPLVKLQNGLDTLVVEFNTMNKPDAVREMSRNNCNEQSVDWSFLNSHKVAVSGLSNSKYNKKWFMVTVIISDTNPSDPLPVRNKARCRIFLNGILQLDRYVDGTLYTGSTDASVLRQNQGNFYIAPLITTASGSTALTTLPTGHDNMFYMGDLMYYNYALDAATIKGLFAAGVSKTLATPPSQSTRVTPWSLDKAPADPKNLLRAF